MNPDNITSQDKQDVETARGISIECADAFRAWLGGWGEIDAREAAVALANAALFLDVLANIIERPAGGSK